MVASRMYLVAIVMFIELIEEFLYKFLYSPNYINKLIKGIKEIIWILAPHFLVLF
jgi:hypothetical protein